MSLGFSKAKENVGSKPYFVSVGKTKEVKVDKGRFHDIELTIVVEIPKSNGETFDKTMWIRGNFVKDGDVVVDWGRKGNPATAWMVENAMKVLEVKPDKDDNLIDETGKFIGDVSSMVGKEFYYISYICKNTNGNIVYNS